jgi:DNA-binding transcriptional LysR family regulator
MSQLQIAKLAAFVAVADHRSFTKAAARIGVTLPTISQTIRSLEDQLGVRLFNRTTRSVALTEVGERLLVEVRPIFDGLDKALESVNLFRDKPAGALRLTASRPYAMMLLAPMLAPFMAQYPEIRVEVVVDDALGDIVGNRFDGGFRVGHRVEQDMTILRVSEEFRMVAVAAPSYMESRSPPLQPKDLLGLDCVLFRAPWDGKIWPWSFTDGRERVEIAASGKLIVNDADLWLGAVLDGAGVGCLPEPLVADHIAEGRLLHLLEDWSHVVEGVFFHHPSRRQVPTPLAVFLRFVETWRDEGRTATTGSYRAR